MNQKTVISRLLLFLTIFTAALTTVRGAELFVDKRSIGGPADDGNAGTISSPWKTISHALKSAKPGDTINIRSGVYNKTIIIMHGGTEGNPLTIKAYAGEEVVLDGRNTLKNGIIFPGPYPDHLAEKMISASGQGDYIIIDGLKLVNFTDGHTDFRVSTAAIYASGRTGLTFRNMSISNIGGKKGENGFGIRLCACSDVEISNNEIHHCYPIYMDAPCFNITIDNNLIHHGTGRKCYAICVHGPCDAVIAKGKISAMTINDNGTAVFTVEGVDLRSVKTWTRHLTGRNSLKAARCPNYALFFEEDERMSNGKPVRTMSSGWITGGSDILKDGREWCALKNNPEWNNKPYSQDGTQCLVLTGTAPSKNLMKAKFVYFGKTFNPVFQTSRDIKITNNIIYDSNCQGIQTTFVDYLFIKGNKIFNCGASGIQIEDGCSHVWLDSNISYANSVSSAGEACIWVALDRDVVVQRNIMYESQIGFRVNSCERVLARWNVIADNKAQHRMTIPYPWDPARKITGTDVTSAIHASAGIIIKGITHNGLAVAPVVKESAFVHNTIYNNGIGANRNHYANFSYGTPKNSKLFGQNVILNNIIHSQDNENLAYIGETLPYKMDGNIYYGSENAIIAIDHKENIQFLSVSTPEGFTDYKNQLQLDSHSKYINVSFVDPGKKNFHLSAGSTAIDAGTSLALTTTEGKGTRIPVDNIWSFSAGYRTSKGVLLEPGDDIIVGHVPARITAIDRKNNILVVDREIKWIKHTPINYRYTGRGPDVGAFEWQL